MTWPARTRWGALVTVLACVGAAPPRSHLDPAALPPLPDLPSVEIQAPPQEAVARLRDHIDRLIAQDSGIREMAAREVLEVSPKLLGAIRGRIGSLADHANHGAMKDLLGRIRREARNDLRQQMRAQGKKGKVETPDYLEMLTRYAKPTSESWRQLVEVVAMNRMLAAIGGVEAARELVEIYVRFGEFLRVDVQLALAELGDAGVAALIEARRHEAAKIGRWAERQLDVLGKGIPSEAIRTDDYEGLADILRAYGRSRDVDAARIIISFSNSERAQVREAARQAVVMLGDAAIWQLRDAFENTVGERPPRDWSWERTARELFGRLDRLRLSRVVEIFESGRTAEKAGDLEAMRQAYNRVLARSPRFENAAQMVSGYVKYARKAGADHRNQAIDAMRRALRLNDDASAQPTMQSLLLTLRAEAEVARGLADKRLILRAIELDRNNDRAHELLKRLERDDTNEEGFRRRYGAAGAVGLLGLFAIAVVLLRRSRAQGPAEATATAGSTTEVEKNGVSGAETRSVTGEPDSGSSTDTETATQKQTLDEISNGDVAGDAQSETRSSSDKPAS